jgi:hypothetical protein
MITEGKEDLLLKTRSFRSFQISQEMSMIAVLRPLGEEVEVLAIACQYSNTFGLTVSRQRVRSGQVSHDAAAFHILLEKRHSKRI